MDVRATCIRFHIGFFYFKDKEYYFDKNNYEFIGNMVDHGDYFALIYNGEFVKAGGLRFNAYRPSYRVGKDRNHLWQRGEFFYSDFIVK